MQQTPHRRNSYSLKMSGTLVPTAVKRGIALEKCRTAGGFDARLDDILKSPYLQDENDILNVKKAVKEECDKLESGSPDADPGYVLDIDTMIEDFYRNAEAMTPKQLGGRKSKGKKTQKKRGKGKRKGKSKSRKN